MKVFVYKSPPIDLGFGIHNNFKIFKLSLIFFDALIERSNVYGTKFIIGIGVPFWKAFIIHNHSK